MLKNGMKIVSGTGIEEAVKVRKKKGTGLSKAVIAILLAWAIAFASVDGIAYATEAAGTENVEGFVTSERNIRNSETLTDMRGVWIAFVDYKNMGLYNKSEKVFCANADKMFKKLKKDNINTVFFHVVPCNDSIYPSKYLKWSKYMFAKAPSYDPLEILIDLAHENDISFHAWLNPYRKTMKKSFNPGKSSSIKRILNIVNEIIDNYDVDGIHMDDYFYPSNGQFRKVSMKKRKKNVNNMIKKVYQAIKETDQEILFGISPAGTVTYAESIGCDLETWLSEDGYMDYIVPQIYWSDSYIMNGRKTKLYSQRLKQWVELNKNDTPMMIGLALYRAGLKDSNDKGWKKKNNIIVTQIKQEQAAGCDGFVLFSSTYMYNKSGKKEMKNYRKYFGITN
ncbi:MAG: family 10 glycosylhydrolase [Lachnospiraceae bacterium]|nr:family 10 glycosylhydrolase [Lachnospiraceae bacterium]